MTWRCSQTETRSSSSRTVGHCPSWSNPTARSRRWAGSQTYEPPHDRPNIYEDDASRETEPAIPLRCQIRCQRSVETSETGTTARTRTGGDLTGRVLPVSCSCYRRPRRRPPTAQTGPATQCRPWIVRDVLGARTRRGAVESLGRAGTDDRVGAHSPHLDPTARPSETPEATIAGPVAPLAKR